MGEGGEERTHAGAAASVTFPPALPQHSDLQPSQTLCPALSLTHVKEELPQRLHPALQGFLALHPEGVCHLVISIQVADAEGERPLWGLLQLPCPDLSLLQGESKALPSPLPTGAFGTCAGPSFASC